MTQPARLFVVFPAKVVYRYRHVGMYTTTQERLDTTAKSGYMYGQLSAGVVVFVLFNASQMSDTHFSFCRKITMHLFFIIVSLINSINEYHKRFFFSRQSRPCCFRIPHSSHIINSF